MSLESCQGDVVGIVADGEPLKNPSDLEGFFIAGSLC
jgi:hypothetical protein